jgi:hypothetical protein
MPRTDAMPTSFQGLPVTTPGSATPKLRVKTLSLKSTKGNATMHWMAFTANAGNPRIRHLEGPHDA